MSQIVDPRNMTPEQRAEYGAAAEQQRIQQAQLEQENEERIRQASEIEKENQNFQKAYALNRISQEQYEQAIEYQSERERKLGLNIPSGSQVEQGSFNPSTGEFNVVGINDYANYIGEKNAYEGDVAANTQYWNLVYGNLGKGKAPSELSNYKPPVDESGFIVPPNQIAEVTIPESIVPAAQSAHLLNVQNAIDYLTAPTIVTKAQKTELDKYLSQQQTDKDWWTSQGYPQYSDYTIPDLPSGSTITGVTTTTDSEGKQVLNISYMEPDNRPESLATQFEEYANSPTHTDTGFIGWFDETFLGFTKPGVSRTKEQEPEQTHIVTGFLSDIENLFYSTGSIVTTPIAIAQQGKLTLGQGWEAVGLQTPKLRPDIINATMDTAINSITTLSTQVSPEFKEFQEEGFWYDVGNIFGAAFGLFALNEATDAAIGVAKTTSSFISERTGEGFSNLASRIPVPERLATTGERISNSLFVVKSVVLKNTLTKVATASSVTALGTYLITGGNLKATVGITATVAGLVFLPTVARRGINATREAISNSERINAFKDFLTEHNVPGVGIKAEEMTGMREIYSQETSPVGETNIFRISQPVTKKVKLTRSEANFYNLIYDKKINFSGTQTVKTINTDLEGVLEEVTTYPVGHGPQSSFNDVADSLESELRSYRSDFEILNVEEVKPKGASKPQTVDNVINGPNIHKSQSSTTAWFESEEKDISAAVKAEARYGSVAEAPEKTWSTGSTIGHGREYLTDVVKKYSSTAVSDRPLYSTVFEETRPAEAYEAAVRRESKVISGKVLAGDLEKMVKYPKGLEGGSAIEEVKLETQEKGNVSITGSKKSKDSGVVILNKVIEHQEKVVLPNELIMNRDITGVILEGKIDAQAFADVAKSLPEDMADSIYRKLGGGSKPVAEGYSKPRNLSGPMRPMEGMFVKDKDGVEKIVGNSEGAPKPGENIQRKFEEGQAKAKEGISVEEYKNMTKNSKPMNEGANDFFKKYVKETKEAPHEKTKQELLDEFNEIFKDIKFDKNLSGSTHPNVNPVPESVVQEESASEIEIELPRAIVSISEGKSIFETRTFKSATNIKPLFYTHLKGFTTPTPKIKTFGVGSLRIKSFEEQNLKVEPSSRVDQSFKVDTAQVQKEELKPLPFPLFIKNPGEKSIPLFGPEASVESKPEKKSSKGVRLYTRHNKFATFEQQLRTIGFDKGKPKKTPLIKNVKTFEKSLGTGKGLKNFNKKFTKKTKKIKW